MCDDIVREMYNDNKKYKRWQRVPLHNCTWKTTYIDRYLNMNSETDTTKDKFCQKYAIFFHKLISLQYTV